MNQSRSNKGRLFGKKNVKGLLPKVPCDIHIEPWWRVEVGLVLEEDVKVCPAIIIFNLCYAFLHYSTTETVLLESFLMCTFINI